MASQTKDSLEDATVRLDGDRPGPTLSVPKVRVEVVGGPDRGLVVELPGPEARVGTSRTCDLVLHDPTVSRVHLVLCVEGGAVRVTDAGSRNGTLLDSTRVVDAYARPDSTLVLGGTTLRLHTLRDTVEVPLSRREQMAGMIGRSVAMRRVFALLERAARTDATVLIEGETGTGKELAAEALHLEGRKDAGPFVVFDCSAVSASLLESELFGHVRGAFTGAHADREGALEAADRGTLFLDEIGELPLDLQPKLLRALERREVRRVGSNAVRRVDVRVVAATNRSLSHEVDRGRFREDLYYRLAVLPVRLPPLRERLGDVPLLVRHFERELAARTGPRLPLPESFVHDLAARAWPGNVRELRNAVARALSLRDDRAPPSAQPPRAREGAAAIDVDLTEPLLLGRERVAEAYERAYLTRLLEQTGGNVSRAAQLAQVNRKLIQRAMKRYGMRGDEEE
jgi:transcriptional regulator with GAF, ATPase, and Fis domain